MCSKHSSQSENGFDSDLSENLSEVEDAFEDSTELIDRKVEFGILFDIDGVLARGLNPLPQAAKMMKLLTNEHKSLSIPVAFVTNGCAKGDAKAKIMSNWFDCTITPEQLIHSQSPLSVFTKWHNKHVLFIGQGPILEIAADLGFTNVCTLDDVVRAYPLLDIVDHGNRRSLARGYSVDHEFPRIECIISIGEPVRWESNLQVLIDLLTHGKPTEAPTTFPDYHLPLLACNMDLVFMAEASMPRFGHGSFLLCLEALYEKITGKPLVYTHIIGKPSEITYRYAEHTLSRISKGIQNAAPALKRMYFIGDNPEVDIKGANLYNKYIGRYRKLSGSLSGPITQNDIKNIRKQISVSASREVPGDAEFDEQQIRQCISILVGTGIYNPNKPVTNENLNHGHRDVEKDPLLSKPNFYFDDCLKAVEFILKKEHVI